MAFEKEARQIIQLLPFSGVKSSWTTHSHVHLLALLVVEPRGEDEVVGVGAGRVLLHDLAHLGLELGRRRLRPEIINY